MSSHQADWVVLLIGGASGIGKTLVAKQLGLRFGASWLEIDDLRLALQRSHVTLPERTEALYFFLQTGIWTQSSESLRDALVALGEVMSPAIEIVVTNHVDTSAPLVIEGDGLLPSLLAFPAVRDYVANGQVRAVFLVEPEADIQFANMLARGRGAVGQSIAELRTEAHGQWLYGQWLASEARRYGLPVLHSRPWTTLAERIIAAINVSNL